MKIVHVELLIDAGAFSGSSEWRRIRKQIFAAIGSIQWPAGSGAFTLHDQPGKKRGQGSGVTPIKAACMLYLQSVGWALESHVDIATRKSPGP